MPQVIEPEELEELLTAPAKPVIVVQIVAPESYTHAHIPGARLVGPPELICGVPPAPGRLPAVEQLNALFTRLGHTDDACYVVVDDEGGGWAGRFAWTLDVIGHHNWRYLNGGIHGWLAAGKAAASGPPPADAVSPVSVAIDTGPIMEAEEIMARLDDPSLLIWDVRSPEEFAGLRQAAARSGHIPGAVNLDWQHLKDPANALRLPANLTDLLSAHGITGREEVVTHCQTHHRSGLSYMIGRLLDFPRIRAYHGSWSEWGNRSDTPISTAP